MLGVPGEFTYLECRTCGCLRISEIPGEMARYYPGHYYSFQLPGRNRLALKRVAIRALLHAPWLEALLRRANPIDLVRWIPDFGLDRDMSILDVGCGAGLLVRDLRALGFRKAIGLDPYIASDLFDKDGVVVRKCSVADLEGNWDRIMLHHSLEHMDNQIAVLRSVGSRLAADGQCIVRIPVVNWAWKEYGNDWVQLDAPRHFWLHTELSFRLAVEKANLSVEKVVYDSSAFLFWGSELYRRGILLAEAHGDPRKFFSAKELSQFRERASELNATGHGDQAIFYLRRNPPAHA